MSLSEMQNILDSLNRFESVSLKQLDSVRLQNRIDSKYMLTRTQLAQVLEGIRENQ